MQAAQKGEQETGRLSGIYVCIASNRKGQYKAGLFMQAELLLKQNWGIDDGQETLSQ